MADLIFDRYDKLAKILPKHNYKIMPSAIEAGFSPQYAQKQGKRIKERLMKREIEKMQGKVIEKAKDIDSQGIVEAKQTMAELLGMSSERVFERLRYIAEQDKDLTSALKVLKPIAKDIGVDLTDTDQAQVNVPVLNIGIREKTPKLIENSEVEVIENGSTEP